jgi:hypothetical protein
MAVRGPVLACCLAFVVGACANLKPPPPSSPPLPFAVGGGQGSEFGNYAAKPAGEVTLDGQLCRVWAWDRPLSATQALRYRSASCPSADSPGRYVARDLGMSVIPMAESDLADPAP